MVKNVLFMLMLVFMGNSLSAQKHYAQPELDKFEGTWEYTDENQTFRIILQKNKRTSEGFPGTYDSIEGYVNYIFNNKVIYDDLDKRPSIILGFIAEKEKSLYIMRFTFQDIDKEKGGDGLLEIIPSKPDEVLWTLRNREGIRVGEWDETFSVPLKLMLRRIR